MKIKLLTTAVLSIMAVSAFGATSITGANFALGAAPGGFAQQIVTSVDNTTPFNGTLMIGTFSTPLGLGTTAGNISLETYGWTLGGSTPFNVSVNQPGLFGATSVSLTLPTAAAADQGLLVGNPIFAVIANGSGDFIVWDTGLTFANEVEGLGGAALSFQTRNVTLLRGIVVEGAVNGLGGSLNTNGMNGGDAITFGVIPEPSTVLLSAFAALGLLRRRR